MSENNPNLDGEVVGSEAEMIPAAKRGELGAHVHLQMLEEVVILKTKKRN